MPLPALTTIAVNTCKSLVGAYEEVGENSSQMYLRNRSLVTCNSLMDVYSFHRRYFGEDDGEMVPRTSSAAGKDGMGPALSCHCFLPSPQINPLDLKPFWFHTGVSSNLHTPVYYIIP